MLCKISHQVRRFVLKIGAVDLCEIDPRLGHQGLALFIDPFRETLVGAVERLGARCVASVAKDLREFHKFAARSLDAASPVTIDIVWLIAGRPGLARLRYVGLLELVLPAVGGIAAYRAGTRGSGHVLAR
jgi:hypothetical protein